MMESSKQIQKAGENSQQYQASTIIINQGVTEERVRAIFSEMIPTALQAYTSDAYALANQRIGKLEDNVWPKLDKVDGLLQAFADPAFQILLRKAQQAAAATEREDDYIKKRLKYWETSRLTAISLFQMSVWIAICA